MKPRPLIRLSACFAMLLVLSDFGPLAASTVRLLQLEGREEASTPLPAVFGNQEEALNLEIRDAGARSGTLSADLFQVSGNLTMPLVKDIHVQDAVVLTGASLQSVRISLKFPDVKQRAEILVRFSLVPSASSLSPTSLGDLRFEVFPTSVTKELTDLLQPKVGGTGSVVLFGAGRKLHHFLADLRVPFEEGGSETPEHFDPNHLYLGELNLKESFQPTEEMKNGGRMAIFSSDETLPAGLYAAQEPSGILIRVTLPLLDNLSSDPRAQLGLIKIIRLLLAPATSVNQLLHL